jgi:hypothetical protein
MHSLIASPKDRVSTIQEVQGLKFYSEVPFKGLRQQAAPFVPMLDNETDVGYFDSFSSPEDMAKYAEVFKKQADVEAVAERGRGEKNAWVGFTFGRNANVGRLPVLQASPRMRYRLMKRDRIIHRYRLSRPGGSRTARRSTPCSRRLAAPGPTTHRSLLLLIQAFLKAYIRSLLVSIVLFQTVSRHDPILAFLL